MGVITAWITNIILLILFASILELLLPNSKMQRYVKLVVGLMLLMVMLQPLLSIFQEDPEEWLAEISNWTDDTSIEETAAMESKKMDIEQEYLAYTSEQVAVQLKEQASVELMERFEVVLSDVIITFESMDNFEQVLENPLEYLSAVYVKLHPEGEEKQEDEVGIVSIEPVKIEREASNEDKDSESHEEITSFLSEHWAIPKEILHVEMKGGEA
ncbi:stage III sporulation protein AF [Evansella tamaricis]|uniref:Stage III sporulation protein AF n=1 Tax=Evansella tamaricis TaxID=2069301 RepID=A0ABS6JG74_9BACI|nr:stage III sporulation protein AF [Evansella tamaricis]MBU9712209.1 stage III sporulation protein AF [Evansella tamaricis]